MFITVSFITIGAIYVAAKLNEGKQVRRAFHINLGQSQRKNVDKEARNEAKQQIKRLKYELAAEGKKTFITVKLYNDWLKKNKPEILNGIKIHIEYHGVLPLSKVYPDNDGWYSEYQIEMLMHANVLDLLTGGAK